MRENAPNAISAGFVVRCLSISPLQEVPMPVKSHDHLEESISAALRLCHLAEPRVERDLARLLGREGLAIEERSGLDAEASLLNALRVFVLVACEIDEMRVGSVLACIRYLAACVLSRSRADGKLH
jgi:hypothetical protein